jgi:dienelactone hydrolase
VLASRRSRALAAAVLLLLGAAAWSARFHARSAALVVRAAGLQGWPRALADRAARGFTEEDVTVPSRHRPLRGRVYRPLSGAHQAALVVPGVHAQGIDEPRFVGFVRNLAGAGMNVVAVEAIDLPQYRITPRATDSIEDAARWLADQPSLAPGGRAGLVGISFAGGLSVVAAGRSPLRDRTAFVVSLGGHGDLPRVLRYLCGAVAPGEPPPHDYGVVIVLLSTLDRMVPPDQAPALREGVLAFLEGSHLHLTDKPRAQSAFERARGIAETLPEPARTLLRQVNDRDVPSLGRALQAALQDMGTDPALSPERAAPPRAPVFLLHGNDDNVIPATEARRLEAHLRPRGTPVRALASPLLTHADVDRGAPWREVWSFVSFWADVLTRR